jgi:hypothetical protein
MFPLIYDWIVTKNYMNEDEEQDNINNNLNNNFNDDYKCFKLKIVLPKIKFSVDNLNIKVHKFLNKHIIANLLQNKFKKWENFIFFDLFGTKKFKIITNLIMLNKYYKLPLKKIKLYKTYKVQNKDYEFFLTQLGENFSIYYTYIPFIVLILFGKDEKKFQKIKLSLKDSISLYKFGQIWGIINTLFKCMFLDTMKNNIFFKFELLEKCKNELYNTMQEKISKNYNKPKLLNLKGDINSSTFKTKEFKANYYIMKEKMKKKYKDRMYHISILNCTLRTITITSFKSEEKYYKVPQNLSNGIFSINDEDKIFNTNCTDLSLMAKYIGENIKEILTAKESNNISEEQDMIEEADIVDKELQNELPKKENVEKTILKKSVVLNIPKNLAEIQKKDEPKQEIKTESEKNIIKVEKRNSNKYNFPKGILFSRSSKKRISIANLDELSQSRFENIARDIVKRRTLNLK